MARTPDIPGVTLERTEVEYEVKLNGHWVGYVRWDHRFPDQWEANHIGSFPGLKVFKGQRARRKAVDWLLEQERAEAA